MTAIPPLVKKGQPVLASHHNALVLAVRSLLNLRGGDGITVSRSRGVMKISLVQPTRRVVDGIITAVNAPGGDPSGAQDLSQVTYDVKVLGDPTTTEFIGMTPTFGRPDLGVDGQPARVGDPCLIIFRKRGPAQETKLVILTEKVIHVECQTQAAQLGSGAVLAALQAEIARLTAELAQVRGALGLGPGGIAGAEPTISGGSS